MLFAGNLHICSAPIIEGIGMQAIKFTTDPPENALNIKITPTIDWLIDSTMKLTGYVDTFLEDPIPKSGDLSGRDDVNNVTHFYIKVLYHLVLFNIVVLFPFSNGININSISSFLFIINKN